MKRSGKITVTFFLNKNVKPETPSPMIGEGDRYPLYLQVTYNRKNTQFRSFYLGCYASLDEALSGKENTDKRKYEELLIRKVVEYEVRHKGKDFQLKGLNDRYLNYSESIFFTVDQYFRNLIYSAVEKSDTVFKVILVPDNMQNASFDIYYKAAERLVNELNNKLPFDFSEERTMGMEFLAWVDAQKEEIRLIDWLDHSAIGAYKTYLIKQKYEDVQVQKRIEFFNRLIKLTKGLVVY